MTVSFGLLNRTYEGLRQVSPDGFEGIADELRLDLRSLSKGYGSLDDNPAQDVDLRLLSWSLIRLGPSLGMAPSEFELEIAASEFVLPGWLPCVPSAAPVFLRRLPAVPFLLDSLPHEVQAAYSGLIEHIEHRSDFTDRLRPELSLTGIIWRVGALVDFLEPKQSDKDGMNQRVGRLRRRCSRPELASPGEQRLWDALGAGFGGRRNVLTHLSTDQHGLTFEEVVDWCLGNQEEVLDLAACISHGVICHAAERVRESEPPDPSAVRWVVEYA